MWATPSRVQEVKIPAPSASLCRNSAYASIIFNRIRCREFHVFRWAKGPWALGAGSFRKVREKDGAPGRFWPPLWGRVSGVLVLGGGRVGGHRGARSGRDAWPCVAFGLGG